MLDVDVDFDRDRDIDPDPDGILPDDATVIDYGLTRAAGWGRVQFPDGSEYWGAINRSTLAILPYREGLAVYYAYGGPVDAPLTHLWRFDTVGHRPPAVRLVDRADLTTGERCALPSELPGPLTTIFAKAEIDVV